MRSRTVHLWRENSVTKDDMTRYRATIEAAGKRYSLWYSHASKWAPCTSTTMDPFVTGSIFLAMQHGDRLVAHGSVNRGLLRNLDRFQEIWAFWEPDTYHKVDLIAEEELEHASPVNEQALVSFSGGADSCFTLHRHLEGLCGRQTEEVTAALMIQGYDIPLEMRATYAAAAESARRLLEPRGVPLIELVTNWRQIMDDLDISWIHSHGAALIACMSLFQNSFGVGLVASSLEYLPIAPWGSLPLTDPLLSSDRFRVVHDGAHVSRPRKLLGLATWPEALDHLRVCWERPELPGNCCACEKCIRTILGFRVMGMELPVSFPHDVSDRQIARLRPGDFLVYNQYRIVRQEAIQAGMGNESWVRALTRAMERYERGETPIMALRRRLKLRTRIKNLLATRVLRGQEPI